MTGRFEPLTEVAGDTYQLFVAYLNAGFNQEQALYLVGQVLGSVPLEDETDEGPAPR